MTSSTLTKQSIINYYHTHESLYGYDLILRGIKHYGYYPIGKENISIANAQELMSLQLGKELGLPEDSLVLDAGCGEGPVSVALAKAYKFRLEGVDLLDFNVAKAKKRALKNNVADRTNFQTGDYSKLSFPDNHFDGVFMIETFVHAPDYKKVLAELSRVLKPGGKIVISEYTKSPEDELTHKQNKIYDEIIQYTSCPAFSDFTNGSFPAILTKAGFINVKVRDVSEYIRPMLKKLYLIAFLPYFIAKLLGIKKHFINAECGIYHYKYNLIGIWRYNIASAEKPIS